MPHQNSDGVILDSLIVFSQGMMICHIILHATVNRNSSILYCSLETAGRFDTVFSRMTSFGEKIDSLAEGIREHGNYLFAEFCYSFFKK